MHALASALGLQLLSESQHVLAGAESLTCNVISTLRVVFRHHSGQDEVFCLPTRQNMCRKFSRRLRYYPRQDPSLMPFRRRARGGSLFTSVDWSLQQENTNDPVGKCWCRVMRNGRNRRHCWRGLSQDRSIGMPWYRFEYFKTLQKSMKKTSIHSVKKGTPTCPSLGWPSL